MWWFYGWQRLRLAHKRAPDQRRHGSAATRLSFEMARSAPLGASDSRAFDSLAWTIAWQTMRLRA